MNDKQTEEYTWGIVEIVKYLKKHLLLIGMLLMVFGGTYLISSYLVLGLWDRSYDFIKGLTWQQEFSLRYGYLEFLLLMLSFCSLIIGIILLRYAE